MYYNITATIKPQEAFTGAVKQLFKYLIKYLNHYLP